MFFSNVRPYTVLFNTLPNTNHLMMVSNTQPALANYIAPIEVDDHNSGTEDVGSITSSTQSLTDSIREHVYENGRRYHLKSKRKYALPSDEVLREPNYAVAAMVLTCKIEQDRLDLFHAYYLELLDGKICFAPLKEDPPNVLDCGTDKNHWRLMDKDAYKYLGTGIWALVTYKYFEGVEDAIGTSDSRN